MKRVTRFPIPFKSLRILSGGKSGSFLIGGYFSATYSKKAERLAASCESFGVEYALHEVPSVHRSISLLQGTDDFAYTKANFIHYLLSTHGKPVLYVDADCELVSEPILIGQLTRLGCDFSVYNFCADPDECVDRFIPIELNLSQGKASTTNRFYRFSGTQHYYSNQQLLALGAVQFYSNSAAARALLSRWHETIGRFPGCADDECLNFTFNNLTRASWLPWLLRTTWLPKSYARLASWIYVQPVINHGDHPGANDGRAFGRYRFNPISDPSGRSMFYRSQAVLRKPFFDRDCIIDTDRGLVCKLVEGRLVPIEAIEQKFWL
jgi:hypothetical protein